jgi:hypothetical protein
MVHALKEAHRVLKPEGLIIDLRPGPVHRRVGIQIKDSWSLVGVMREDLSDDRAADRAVKAAIHEDLIRPEGYSRFDVKRHVGTLARFQAFLDEFATLGANLPPHDWLVDRLAALIARQSTKPKIVVRGPIQLRILRKRTQR